jgi:hypothetical protein|tara:strand:- start:2 stop:607 length:606 start_codon:yes stop_codon:yes gene_type:complete
MDGLLQYVRDVLYGGIQKGEYKKRKGAIKKAYAADDLTSQLQTVIQGEAERNINTINGQRVPHDNPPLEYDYPQGWENPMAGVGVTGSQDRKHDFSNYIRATNPAGSEVLSTSIQDGDGSDMFFQDNTVTPYGRIISSQRGRAGNNPTIYHKYPEGFGGLPAHEGSYTSRNLGVYPFNIGYQTSPAPKDMSLRELILKRFK